MAVTVMLSSQVQCNGECTAREMYSCFPEVSANCWRQPQSLNDQATYFSLLFQFCNAKMYLMHFQFLLHSFDDASFSWSLCTGFVLEYVCLVLKLLSKLNMKYTWISFWVPSNLVFPLGVAFKRIFTSVPTEITEEIFPWLLCLIDTWMC